MKNRVAVYIKTESCEDILELISFDKPDEVVSHLVENVGESPYYWSFVMTAGDCEEEVLRLIRELRNSTYI